MFISTLLFAGMFTLLGCASGIGKSFGVGKRPYMPYISPPVLTDGEKNFLIGLEQAQSGLMKRLRTHNNKQSDVITEYMKQAVEVNRKQMMDVLGYDRDVADTAIRADLKKMGWPDEHELVKNLRQEPK